MLAETLVKTADVLSCPIEFAIALIIVLGVAVQILFACAKKIAKVGFWILLFVVLVLVGRAAWDQLRKKDNLTLEDILAALKEKR